MTARHFRRSHGAPLHLTDSPASAPAPVLSPSEVRIAQLERDKKSLQARCAMLLLFANGHAKPSLIATIRGEAKLETTLRTAAMIESHGGVPCVRWARDAAGVITGIEFGVLDGAAGGKPQLTVAQ